MKYVLLFAAAILLLQSNAQITTPITSPPATITQKVGIVDVKVEYNRPAVKGRKIFGGLIPFDQAWRTGANAPTKITFSDSIMIGGKKIAGGTYGLYTIPSSKDWTIILGKKSNAYAWDHKEEDDAVRFKVPVLALSSLVESFSISFENVVKSTANVVLNWENTSVIFTIENDADTKIMAEIKDKTENIDTYWAAANYYFDNGKDLKKAAEWATKVVEKNPQFWTYNLKARIHAKAGDCKAAVEAAKKSIELAKIAKNDESVKANEKLMADCKPVK